jgi:hypothetical protein
MIVLDTDHLSELERRGSAKGGKLLQRLQLQSDPIAATIVSIEEQFRGRLAGISRIPAGPKQVHPYSKLIELIGSTPGGASCLSISPPRSSSSISKRCGSASAQWI